jgi:hypothetical protein
VATGLAPDIEAVAWPALMRRLRRDWQPGQHMAMVAPTGQGKTTALCSLLNDTGRKFELAFDAKGGDSTLAALGWPRVSKVPPPKPWWHLWYRDPYERMAEGEPYRRIVGRIAYTWDDLDRRLPAELRASLNRVFEVGGFTVAIDEFQIVADRRLMDLGTEVERLLIAARDKGVSVVVLFQAPRNVPRAGVDQCAYVWIALTRDRDVVERIAEICGRSTAEIEGAIQGLGSREYAWMIAPNNPRKPIIVTIPPYIPKRQVRTA